MNTSRGRSLFFSYIKLFYFAGTEYRCGLCEEDPRWSASDLSLWCLHLRALCEPIHGALSASLGPVSPDFHAS